MPRVCSGFALENGDAAMRCIFAEKQSGQRSRAGLSGKCVFCDLHALAAACRTDKGQNKVIRSLRAFRKVYEDQPHTYNCAMMRVPEELREDLHARALAQARPPARAPRGQSAAESAAAAAAAWDAQLASRKRALRSLGKKRWTAYKKRRTADRSRVVKKFYVDQGLAPPPPTEARDVAENDCGLPAPESGERASFVEAWCKLGSWGVCGKCHSLQPRPLLPVDTRRVAKPDITEKACKRCRRGETVPQWGDIPHALRRLTADTVDALRPFEIDLGPFKQAENGFRIHTAMFRVKWAARSAEEKILELKRGRRRRARAAFEHLMSAEESEYRVFTAKHKKFLRRHPEATEHERKRPLQECALWPHLYWATEMTETCERNTDSRRLQAGARQRPNGQDSEDEEEEEAAERHSVKRSFLRKVLGPIVGYSQDFELLQFVHDLALWSRVGGGKNACAGLFRLVLKGETFSPLYWKTKHQALVDMQRQCGFPALFKTMAPWEVLQELELGGRGRRQLAGPETLHTAHVFLELNRGLYSGLNSRGKDGWKDHILAGEDGRPTVANYFQRLEFQDGKRKLPSQDYHGSGRVHVHSLDYLQNVEAVGLERKMCAATPPRERPLLHGLALGRPHGRSDSGWPVEPGPSRWDAEARIARLQHSEEEKEAGFRAFFPETLEVTKCHQDVLHGNGHGLLLKYVSTYTPKFSDSFAREWLNDEASAFSVARRVLFDYQPAEPEMWLYLAAQQFPPCKYGGTMTPFLAPWPGMAEKPAAVTLYEQCPWRRESMSLLEYMRKSNKDGEIAQWLVRAFRQTPAYDKTAAAEEQRRALVALANEAAVQGEKLIACDVLSIFNDRWFGQWLALRRPFRNLNELMCPEVAAKVPPQYAHLANTTCAEPGHWADEDLITQELELEAAGKDRIQTFLAKVKAERALAEKFLSGALDREDDVGLRAALVDVGLRPAEEDPLFRDMDLNAEQPRPPARLRARRSGTSLSPRPAMKGPWQPWAPRARARRPSWTRSRSKCSGTGAGCSSRFPRVCKPRERGSDTRRRMWTRARAPFCSTRTSWKPWTS